MKLTREQVEKLQHAMDNIFSVMCEIEETGKNKRVVKTLDKVIGILYEIIIKQERKKTCTE